MSASKPTTLLRYKDLHARIGLSRSALRLKIVAGDFPAPIRLGHRTKGWIEADVEAWLQKQIRVSRKASGTRGAA
jgi:prophage regulatory protein